jgi:glycosyltransferase involved in cell wall biosynthesis
LSETQGLVLVEALAAGLPIVAVDTPQTRDVLGGAGTVVPATATGLAAALARVLAVGPQAAQISPIALRFDGPRLAGSMLDLYADLLGNRRVPAGVPA